MDFNGMESNDGGSFPKIKFPISISSIKKTIRSLTEEVYVSPKEDVILHSRQSFAWGTAEDAGQRPHMEDRLSAQMDCFKGEVSA